jgi:hypothetical protein
MKRMIDPVRLIMNLALICWTLFLMLIASVGYIAYLLTQ